MGIVSLPSFGSDPVTVTAAKLDAKVDPLATEFNGNIENANIKSSAAISYSKLNLSDAITNADIYSSAAIAASKLDLSPVAQQIAMSGANIDYAKGDDIASATTTDIASSTGNVVDVTGTTTITGLGTAQAGAIRFVQFDGALTLTHNATSLILPTAANITTAAGDCAMFQSEGSGNWRCLMYTRASGAALVGAQSAATQAEQETGSSTTVYVTPGRQHYHQSAAKAWCMFDGTATGTNAPTAGYNVTSVTRNGTGDYTVTFTTAFSSANYCAIPSCSYSGNGEVASLHTLAAGTCRIATNDVGITPVDPAVVTFLAFGDL
jgi:hypothetical protein